MKDGRRTGAQGRARDLQTGAVVAVTLQAADEGDTTTKTLVEQLEAAAEEALARSTSRSSRLSSMCLR